MLYHIKNEDNIYLIKMIVEQELKSHDRCQTRQLLECSCS